MNKEIVKRFNEAFLEKGDLQAFDEIISPDFINHTAMPGISKGKDGILQLYRDVIQPALPDLRIEIYDMIAEGDTVVTRKAIIGTLHAPFMGMPGNGQQVIIPTIDIVKLKDGKYMEHWAERHIQQASI
ncbi:conserved hypothetical protein, steroid delta-isomerase-related [Chitinophaga sp. CF118]|uniref:ester cyclase n=1 Tax=Chitinophaga sp. CF118 TaxID=1884367 RepID=UPI0008E6B96F|nr:ester cyclase [Chitinophaga sp. CF118]SFD10469.1 conserved hypothetical protein, steroid delta-isomerase-related [Chitinophaga sp. CF118]